ncbi:hypothetical protein CDL15_Pgr012464 [Punica granatum]|uniref:Nodulin-like domain-containing protein n=1 Tax=Punica granatum TaxID=22663 RepID=A0A218X0A4_PUNGR|nr:hypothetical protein CDL15_Pgr012464 [Punica granatum]
MMSSPVGKWLGFVIAIWVQAIAGNNYTFSNYSHALKSLMSLTQLQLNHLSVTKDIGKAFGLVSGLASDCLPTSIVLLIGSIEGLIGFGAQWLVVSKHIASLPYWQMCIFMCMGGNSTTWMNTAVLVTCMRNFPRNCGPVSGLLKGYVGLSTAIFTDICSALFSSSPSAFLLMLAIVPAIICLIAALFFHESQPAASDYEGNLETRLLNILNVIAIVLASYLSVFDFAGYHHNRVVSLAFAVGLVALLAMPLGVPFYLIMFKRETVDFWVLFMSFLCGVGTGMCIMNNMGQMGPALGYSDVSIFVSLTSIWGFFGRIALGLVSEHYICLFCISGYKYTLSNCSHGFKSLMSVTQLHLKEDTGKASRLVSALASDRFSTSIVFLRSLECLITYGAQWLVVNKHIAILCYW